MWLLSEQKPHYKTIADFRKDNPKAFKAEFRYFVAMLKEWMLIEEKPLQSIPLRSEPKIV